MKKTITLFLMIFNFLINLTAQEISFMNEKENARIENVLMKIKMGQDVTVAALGGSITTGYAASPINEKSWASLTGKWFKQKALEKNCSLKFLNEGLSGTDSAFAAVRINDHIIKNNADLVILEFAMNDQWLEKQVRNRSYEGIIRQMMNNSERAVMALFVNERFGQQSSQQLEQEPVCRHYHIPFVSWKDCMKEEYGTSPDWNKYFDGQEGVHPSNTGHAKIAEYIIQKLEEIWASLPESNEMNPIAKELPSPLTDTSYEYCRFFTNDNIEPETNTGWTKESPVHPEWPSRGNAKKGWSTKTENAEITFRVKAKGINVLYAESDGFRDCEAWVTDADGNNSKKVKMTCAQASRKGYLGWAAHEVINGKEEKEYILHINCPKRRKTDQGKPCNIIGFIVY